MAGTLVGTALGDALGLVTEGMSATAIERRFSRLDSFRFFGRTGFVSDDTEPSALVAHARCRGLLGLPWHPVATEARGLAPH